MLNNRVSLGENLHIPAKIALRDPPYGELPCRNNLTLFLRENFSEFSAQDFSRGGFGDVFNEVNFAGLLVVG